MPDTGSGQLPSLSPELIGLIANFLFELNPPKHSGNVENETICCVKPSWCDVRGFMQAAPGTHKLGFRRWVSVLTIRKPEDWEVAFKDRHWIRELVCLDGTILPPEASILAQFPRLRAVCLDSHEDVQFVAGVNHFVFCGIFSSLPPTVRHLELKHAHGPDINIISCAKRHCPELESLWLGRCTMFNRVPPCSFWESFPSEHDSYMENRGIDAYALLGEELSPFRGLKSIRLGVYLVPSTTVLAHRLFHTGNLPVPPTINWQALFILHPDQNGQLPQPQPESTQVSDLITLLHRLPEEDTCERCRQDYFTDTRSIEEDAAGILKRAIPSLELIEWMDWFSSFHLGVRSYPV
ncbi:unnamed protein product [Rhizoctonia solani]|uniref:F-box domain-containing protein n=1 Tax=Rhizoctonia solani TaxID=456999 RepID=A0A8H3HWJ8_9AGAM|nr:unnamed protein product [Rhizoctonia solani]